MTIPSALRAATAVLLTLGMTTLGTAAAFADDAVPPPDPAPVSAPPADPAPDPEPAPQADPAPAPDPAPPAAPDPEPPASDPPASDPPATEEPTTEEPTDAAPPRKDKDAVSPVQSSSLKVARSVTPPDPTPYVLLAWSLPCGVANPWCPPGQTLVHVLDLASPSLSALDNVLQGTCNDWQVDLENDSVTTRNLIAVGVLTGPNSPPEDHAYGAVAGNPWKYVDNPDCTPVTPAAQATDQSCAQGTTLVGGHIQLTVIAGVNYTITGPSGNVPFDGTGLTAALPPGAYQVAFTLDSGYSTSVTSPIALTIGAYTDYCAITVNPAATATQQGCDRGHILVGGTIQLTLLDHVTYSITGPGGPVSYDVGGLATGLAPGAYHVSFVLDAGYGTMVSNPIELTVLPYDGVCDPIQVTPAASATPQTCVQNVFLTEGSIQVTLLDHVTYTVTGPGGAVPLDVTGNTGPIPPGAYSVAFTTDPGYAPTVSSPIALTVDAFPGTCDLTTAPLVVPLVSFTPPSCTSGGSYTLSNDLATPGAVLWTVNGTPGVVEDTYSAARGSTVTIEAAPNAPVYGFSGGQQTSWTHTFSLPSGTACGDNLAFTGGGSPMRLALIGAVLSVSGLLLLRARRERLAFH